MNHKEILCVDVERSNVVSVRVQRKGPREHVLHSASEFITGRRVP
jgi:hypothetical protein